MKNNTFRIFLLIFFTSTIGCNNTDVFNVKLNDIEKLVITPNYKTYKLVMNIEGQTDCKTEVQIFSDGKLTNISIPVNEVVDTIVKYEWYQNELNFSLNPPNCGGDANVKILLYY